MSQIDGGRSFQDVKDGRSVNRRMVLLTDGHSDPVTAKTASCLLRFCPDEVVAVLDRNASVGNAEDLLGVGGAIPVVKSLHQVPQAHSLVIGIAPHGGIIPATWRPLVIQA